MYLFIYNIYNIYIFMYLTISIHIHVKALYALNGVGAVPTALNPSEIRKEKSRQQMLLQKAKAKAKSNDKNNKKTPRKG